MLLLAAAYYSELWYSSDLEATQAHYFGKMRATHEANPDNVRISQLFAKCLLAKISYRGFNGVFRQSSEDLQHKKYFDEVSQILD